MQERWKQIQFSCAERAADCIQAMMLADSELIFAFPEKPGLTA
jgi:hypothetical protein